MARVPVLVLALVATTSSLIMPTEEHQREMKVRLAEAAGCAVLSQGGAHQVLRLRTTCGHLYQGLDAAPPGATTPSALYAQ